MTELRTVGQRLRLARTAHELTLRQLATDVELSPSHLGQLEADEPSPANAPEMLDRLARSLRLNPDWLRDGSEPMLFLSDMTAKEQIRKQSGPGTKGLPSFFIGGGGCWVETGDGWKVDRRERDGR